MNYSHCFSCGRNVGLLERVCPYCETETRQAARLVFLRTLAIAIAAVGSAFFVFSARNGLSREVRISEITPFYQTARISISGIAGSPYITKKEGRVSRVSFRIYDGQNQALVAASGEGARRLADKGLIPERGEKVRVSGTVRVRPNDMPVIVIGSGKDIRQIN